MSDVAIRVEGLGKQYRIGARRPSYGSLRETLTEAVTTPFKRLSRNGNGHLGSLSSGTIWALRDVSFEVKSGEVVGVIGRNGAGKSTLLKILSRITEPTMGEVDLYGRVGSLLEVGTGFNLELTGAENIYLNGAILGMRRREIERNFDAIVDFAEVEKFIDTPVKHYSSGMYLRLAFAVAAHLEPEILLVDEVLAVGDQGFQTKCLGKMSEVAKHGRTILFVSHNMGAISRLCERVIWLDDGKVMMDGSSAEVVNSYHTQFLTVRPEWKRFEASDSEREFDFLSIAVKDSNQQPSGVFSGDEPIFVEVTYIVSRTLAGCQIGTRICNFEGVVIFSTSDADTSGTSALAKEVGFYASSFQIPQNFLAPGTYYISIGAHLPNRDVYGLIEQAVVFEVSASGSLASLDGRLGVITPLIHWDVYKKPLPPQ
jgi:lipopolysaccharide transport system ATP-binding protein